MTQFKVKNGKNYFYNFENLNYLWFRHIPRIINTFYVIIESRNSGRNVIDQHCQPVRWLPTVILAKMKIYI